MSASQAGYCVRNAACCRKMTTNEFANKFMAMFWTSLIRDEKEPDFVDNFAEATGFDLDVRESSF